MDQVSANSIGLYMNTNLKLMAMIKGNALQILQDRYSEIEEDMTFREFVEQQADIDPDFYRTLFTENSGGAAGSSLNERQLQAYKDFLDSI